MYLPENIQNCINLLENAGFAAYAVGGCVRDACLGLSPHDYDLCTSALPSQTESVFKDYRLVLAGEKHVSALYDTCVFEFKDGAARNVLSHIQQEEQQHGKMLFDYMQANGMYQ